jgi:hypothetical protein
MGKKCKEAYREWKENNDEQVMFSRKQKTAPKTVSVQDEHHQTVILSADGAKILKDLDEAIESYRNDKVTKEKTFIGKVAEILNAKTDGSNSQYATFETVNGNVIEVSNVSSIHSKDATTEIGRLSLLDSVKLKEYLRWVEKEKVSEWLGLPYEEERQDANPKLVSIANVIESFENLSVEEEKVLLMVWVERKLLLCSS